MRIMRLPLACAALAGHLVTGAPAVAQQVQQTSPAATDPQLVELRDALLSAQQEIVRLRAEAANRQDLEGALKAAREKNERLVGIANELIAAYEKRYARGQFLPFDTGRRKLEAELQASGDRAYDNRWDASPRRPAPSPDAAAQPAPDAQ